MDFPDHCLRGLRDKDHYTEYDNTITLKGYLPDTRTQHTREDKGYETSINWEDTDSVIEFTLNTQESGKKSFPFGIVRLPLVEIQRIIDNEATKNMISYERCPVDGNEYHGNIVFQAGLSQLKQNMIASVLATYSSKVRK
ncbi:MAG: hypothetical protein C3F13_02855 [Anaerolineales bacterium]|nr:MAG: hypothetical protein C3F13_02855 [Anaerolineales bacterium]